MPSFYDSDSNNDATEPNKRTPRVKETPFKIAKSSRKSRSKSRSPMVPSTSTKSIASGRTPKGRLRHENSQLQFEPIISSPSNPNDQESQILTERQREVYERQMRSSNVFADMRPTSPRPAQIGLARSPLEFHSDAMSVDGLPTEASRTPLKNVRALGEMEVFVGSSPTPQARTRSQEVVSDRTSMATPTAVRTARSAHNIEELGSSPPRFEKGTLQQTRTSQLRDEVESFEANQDMDDHYGGSSLSFDDGMTIDEDDLLTGTPDEDPDKAADEHDTELDASDVPSSTLDLQLTAQLDAEMQAQKNAAVVTTPSQLVHEHEQITVRDPPVSESFQSNMDTTSTSRVGDSFSSLAADSETSQVRSLRRSERNPSASSPQSTNAKKRKSSSGRGPGRPKKNKTEATNENDVTTTPQAQAMSAHGLAASPTPTNRTAIVPDSVRARNARRSASLLRQVEKAPEDIVVEDTPAPKRARRSIDKDVSEARQGTPATSQESRMTRLSHVQVTPRHGDASSVTHDSRAAVGDVNMQHTSPEASASLETPLGMGEQSTHVVAQQRADATHAASQVQESQVQLASHSAVTPSRSFAERVMLTPRSIIDKLKALKDAVLGTPQLVLSPQEHHEADALMFKIRMAVHAAGARGEEPGQ